MTATPTPRAITFKEPDIPMIHVPEWREFNEDTRRVACKRCHRMIDVVEWSRDICPGEPAKEKA